MFKQDTTPMDNPDNQIWVKTDNDTASVNLVDPATVNLFSNLDQLVHLKDPNAGAYTFKLEYPRVIDDKPYYIWIQSSNPLTDAQVAGYQKIVYNLDASRLVQT